MKYRFTIRRLTTRNDSGKLVSGDVAQARKIAGESCTIERSGDGQTAVISGPDSEVRDWIKTCLQTY